MTYIRQELNCTPVIDSERNISSQDCELQRIELCIDVQKRHCDFQCV